MHLIMLQEDLYYPHPLAQDMLWGFLHHFAEPVLTRWPFSKLREKALKVAMEHVHYEDMNSRYLCIGCVEKVMITLGNCVKNNSNPILHNGIIRNSCFVGVMSYCLLGRRS